FRIRAPGWRNSMAGSGVYIWSARWLVGSRSRWSSPSGWPIAKTPKRKIPLPIRTLIVDDEPLARRPRIEMKLSDFKCAEELDDQLFTKPRAALAVQVGHAEPGGRAETKTHAHGYDFTLVSEPGIAISVWLRAS